VWDGGGTNGAVWSTNNPANWNPDGNVTTNERAIIGSGTVYHDQQTTMVIGGLVISNGATLAKTAGNRNLDIQAATPSDSQFRNYGTLRNGTGAQFTIGLCGDAGATNENFGTIEGTNGTILLGRSAFTGRLINRTGAVLRARGGHFALQFHKLDNSGTLEVNGTNSVFSLGSGSGTTLGNNANALSNRTDGVINVHNGGTFYLGGDAGHVNLGSITVDRGRLAVVRGNGGIGAFTCLGGTVTIGTGSVFSASNTNGIGAKPGIAIAGGTLRGDGTIEAARPLARLSLFML
jgi:hypothetical protein